MLSLLVATLFSSAFALILRDAIDRRCNAYMVGVVNYALASASQIGLHLLSPEATAPRQETLGYGAAVGVFYALNFVLFIPLLGRRGVSVTSAMLRLAVIFPILASLLIWGERLTAFQAVGAGLSLAALPLLTLTPGASRESLDRHSTGLLLLLLLGNGASMVLTKAYGQAAAPGQDALFLAALFGTAFIVSVGFWLFHRHGTSRKDILPGLSLGATNALANWGLVSALGLLPGVLVFPFYSAVGLVFSAILARVIFAERVSRLEMTGIVAAVAAVALANLG